jgi:serine phosphatase RsbU (regulator of sigma subunit)
MNCCVWRWYESGRYDYETSGFPIGMFGRLGYASTELQVEAGSHIVIFTDGLADAQTPSGEEFGDERV